MPAFEVDYSAYEKVFGTVVINADDAEQAEIWALEDIKERDEYTDIEIEMIKEVK